MALTRCLAVLLCMSSVALDAMAFRDEAHGTAFSDSVDGRFVLFTTRNGGTDWIRVPAEHLPRALLGEGAFAASDTNLAMGAAGQIWIGTTASRVLRSLDGGRTWSVTASPLATGAATGIFSMAFRDASHGIVVGGNYQQESGAVDNVATTSDGGATWTLVRERGLSGFRSVVAWLPGSSAGWLAVGPSGSDVSADDGRTWTPAGDAGRVMLAAPVGRARPRVR